MSLARKKLQNPVIFKLKFCSFLVSSLYLPLFCENVIYVDFTWFLISKYYGKVMQLSAHILTDCFCI